MLLMGLPGQLLGLKWVYDTQHYDELVIARLSGHYMELLRRIPVKDDEIIRDLSMTTDEEKQLIQQGWEGLPVKASSRTSIHQLFESKASSSPTAVAIVSDEIHITYEDLNAQANRLARYLQTIGIQSGSFVALGMNRSPEMITALLAILKLGAAYVPIDPLLPEERILYMLQDTGSQVLLTMSRDRVEWPSMNVTLLPLDRLRNDIDRQLSENLNINLHPESAAYVNYTSGSTGLPKGVVVPHRGVVRLVQPDHYIELSVNDVVLQGSTISFDAATFEIWGSLCNGATLALLNVQTPSLAELGEAIQRYNVTAMWMTSGLFTVMVDESIQGLSGLKSLLVGGDLVSPVHVRKVKEAYPELEVINGYGPTENTTFTCCHRISADDYKGDSIPIGRPINGTYVHILNARLEPVPIGVAGELYIGGEGLAIGYLNLPDLNAQQFIESPFCQGERLYRSGDLVRWLPDGNIAYIGRADHQVKVRGFRVELGEIQTRLLRTDKVKKALVTARRDEQGLMELIAYVVPHDNESIEQIKKEMTDKLPAYMMPSHWIQLEALPLTANGKFDHKNLPEPVINKEGRKLIHEPVTEMEIKIRDIWRDVLKRDDLGLYDNFFEHGGHSLKTITIISKMEAELHVRIPIREFYTRPTIREMAVFVEELQQIDVIPPDRDDQIVMIRQDEDAECDIFLIHGGNGEIYANIEFIHLLSFSARYWGLRMNRFEGLAPYEIDIKQLAEEYIIKIQRIQPENPIHLMGWSFGGTLAFEIARQLELKGREVKFLAVIDSLPPLTAYEGKVDCFTVETEMDFIQNCLSQTSEIAASYRGISEIGPFWSYYANEVERHANCAVWERDIKEQQNIRLFLPNHEEIRFRDVLHYINRSRSLGYARDMYVPDSLLKSTMYFIKATQSGIMEQPWNRYTEAPIEVLEVDGTHESIFEHPGVKANAQRFDQLLHRVLHKTAQPI
ncbi:Linear gramicidin synthase subunit B [compost metagenome]